MSDTVFRAFASTAAAHAENAFWCAAAYGGGEITYGAALAQVKQLAGSYGARGWGPGHRVALLLENRPEFILHYLALNAVGASCVPLNPDYRQSEMDYVLGHSEAALVVTLAQHAARFAGRAAVLANAALAAAFDPPAAPVIAGASTRKPEGAAAHSVARTAPRAFDTADTEDAAARDSECALLYTSGTTGTPKGCLLSNDYVLAMGQRYLDEGGLCALRSGTERLLTPLPLFHMNALAFSTTAMILCGGCVIQLDRFHPATWWRIAAETRATVIHYLGVMPAILLGLPASEHERGHAVRFGYGANVNPKDHAAFEVRYGFPLVEGWAMTETGAGALISAKGEPRHVGVRCLGTPPPGLDIRLVDEAGIDVAQGAPGELLVRQSGANPRKHFFSGYLKDSAATEHAWRGGWFHTGDAMRRDADGNMYFVDRRKNIIRRSGENIAALEVEAALAGHPAIAAVAVIAAPDDMRDEEVMACVVPVSGAARDAATAASIQAWCQQRLAYFKAPGWVLFIDALPVTATNKVQKARLSDFGANPLAHPQCFDLRANKRRVKRAETNAPAIASKSAPTARSARQNYDGVVIAAPVTIPYARYSVRSAHWWLARALGELLRQTGIAKDDLDGLAISSFTLAPDSAIGLTQQLGVSPRWLDHIPLGGASAVVALRRAARAVQAGDARYVACVSGDTNHVDSFRLTLANFSQFARDAVYPYGAGGPNASFAFLTQYAMRTQGVTRADFGKLCVAQRANALHFEHALFKKPLTLDEYLNARPVATPLALFDCVMPCAGADAFMVMREEDARALGLKYACIKGTIERHNAFANDPIQYRAGWALDSDDLYAQAGVGPAEIDCVQAYDDYPVITLMQLEDLGFCAKGEGAAFIRANTFTHDGSFPLNTSGGQLSAGQAGAAGGFLGMVEGLRQLTGAAGGLQAGRQVRRRKTSLTNQHGVDNGSHQGRQVDDGPIVALTNGSGDPAQHVLVSGFGMINYDRGLGSGAAILARAT